MSLPSVTQIIGPYIDTRWFKEEHSARGTAVHAACGAYLQGLYVPELEPGHQPYFNSFRRWADEMVDEVVLVETRLFDKRLKFSGRPDFIARIRGDAGLTLCDLKTSQAEAKWWPVQIAAYRHLAKVDKGITTVSGMSVRLKSDDSKALGTRYPSDYRIEFNIFLGVINAVNYFSE